MEITPHISRGQVRAVARALNRLADGCGPIDPDRLSRELRRIGLGGEMPPPVATVAPAPDHRMPVDDATQESVAAVWSPPTRSPDAIWVRPREAARLAGVGMTTLYEWLNSGRLVSRRIGGRRLVLLASIRDLADDPPEALPQRAGGRGIGRYGPRRSTETLGDAPT